MTMVMAIDDGGADVEHYDGDFSVIMVVITIIMMMMLIEIF